MHHQFSWNFSSVSEQLPPTHTSKWEGEGAKFYKGEDKLIGAAMGYKI